MTNISQKETPSASATRDADIVALNYATNQCDGFCVPVTIGSQEDIERPAVSAQADNEEHYQNGRVFQTSTGQQFRMNG